VAQLLGGGPAEGWHPDPYGRHELRFFDGQKWTPYVRNGGENEMDEPGDPMIEALAIATRSALLDERVFVVERSTDMFRRWSDRAVHRSDGSRAGVLRRVSLTTESPHAGVRSPVPLDQTKYDVVELRDDEDALVITLIRPLGGTRTSVGVCDAEGEDAGRIVEQTLAHGETTYSLIGPNGTFLGDLQSDNWAGWDLRVVDSNENQVATISRDSTGLDRSSFRKPDDYVVRIARPLHEPLRTLVIACALSLEIIVRPQGPQAGP
jgi:hypothetical protein